MTIGENIKKTRNAAGLTQKELGIKLGVSASAIGQFEKSDNLRFETLERISSALEVPLSEIIETSENILKDFSEHPEHWEDVAYKYTANQYAKLKKHFSDLNTIGKEEAVKRVEELTHIEKYTQPDDK